MPPTTTTVSPELVEKFDRDGYQILDDFGLPPDTFDAVEEELGAEYSDGDRVIHEGVVYERTRIQDAWRFNEKVRSIARSPVVLSLLEEIYGREPRPFQTLNLYVG